MAMRLKWQFGEALEALEKEIDKIVGPHTLEELLDRIPPEIPYDDSQTAKLTILKCGDLVWQVSYQVFLDAKTRHFEKVSIKAVTEPSLKLALFEMLEELNKPNKKKKSNEQGEDGQEV